jgi:hypothetical protein
MNSDNLGGVSMQEKVLVIFLRITGAILLIALIPAVMPFFWMQEIHRWLGLGELPTEPIVGYLTRSLSLMYAALGALICFVSGDVRRFLPLVKFLAILSIVFGGGMIALDAAVGMPTYWIACEGPLIIPLGIVILWLAKGIPEIKG